MKSARLLCRLAVGGALGAEPGPPAGSLPVPALAAQWEGTWSSDADGHHGKLRCRLTPLGPDRYRARYKATYWKLLRFSYAVTLRGQATNGVFRFQGEANLGWWAGGVYRYAGQITATNLLSTYRSKYDHGTFQLRPAGENAPHPARAQGHPEP